MDNPHMRDGLISSPWNLTLVGLHPVQDWAMNINTRIMNKSWPYCDMRNGSHIALQDWAMNINTKIMNSIINLGPIVTRGMVIT